MSATPGVDIGAEDEDDFQWTEDESEDEFDVIDPDINEMDDYVLLRNANARSAAAKRREPLAAGEPRPRGRRPGEVREEQMDADVAELIGKANQSYGIGDYEDAIKFAEEALGIDGNTRSAYNLLCSIYDDMKEPRKALVAKVAAAHLNKTNKDDWIEIAERSFELNLLHQAVQFFQHASRIARDDWSLLLRRSQLHLSVGEYQRSLTLLRRIQARFFDILADDQKTQVLLEMARVLKQMGEPEEAVALYMDIYNRSLYPALHGDPEVVLNWQNLNVLAELFYDQKQYQQAISVIRNGSRWILGRADSESFWAKPPFNSNDAEFDDRRLDPSVRYPTPLQLDPAAYELPIDIRVWLLVCRLKLSTASKAKKSQSNLEDAMIHLEFLTQCVPVEDYSDLYQRAAGALFQSKEFHKSLELYVQLSEAEWEDQGEYVNMLVQAGKCQMHLGSLRQAEALYDAVIQFDPENSEALVGLAEIYHSTNRQPLANSTLDRVQELRAREASSGVAVDDTTFSGALSRMESEVPEGSTNSEGVFVDTPRGPSTRTATRLTRAERAELERRSQDRADRGFEGLDRFSPGLDAGNVVAAKEWLRHAQELIGLFAENRKFFPSDKNKVAILGHSSDQQSEINPDNSDNDDGSDVLSIFKGRSIDIWFIVFMKFAIGLVRVKGRKGLGDALSSLRIAKSANVFYLDRHRDVVVTLVRLSCEYRCEEGHLVSETLRHLYMQHQFNPLVLLAYTLLLSQHPESFGSSNNQKFFLRQIKSVDAAVHGERVEGAARIIDAMAIPTKECPLLFVLYAFIMLLGPSYVPALTYMLRAYEHLPDDPVVLLTLGVIHVQRAIQRVSTNRHLQILEGLSYMRDYFDVRSRSGPGEEQEALYNMGRFFHGIGLFSNSVEFYERALAIGGSMSPVVAYNLHLIYAMSGNMELAKKVVDKYLVI